MFVQIIIFLMGCSPKTDSISSVAHYNSPEPSPSSEPDTSVTDSDTAEPPLEPCPSGMVPVPPTEPEFCIMAYEAHIPNSTVGAGSEAGVLPAINVSLLEAIQKCEDTPVQVNGEIIAHLRLASLSEWRDAGDGMLGEGGTDFPWGDAPHSDQCVMGSGFESYQVSGSLESCRSVFGVYDQIGNIWEWVSTDTTADITAWVEQQNQLGLSIQIEDERILLNGSESLLVTLLPLGVGLNFESFLVDSDGEISILGSPQGDRTLIEGYIGTHELVLSGDAPQTGDLLPVSIDFSLDPENGQIRVPSVRNGEPIGVKVGGAYYSGWDSDLHSIFYGHIPNFNGTIGFRCVSDPIPTD